MSKARQLHYGYRVVVVMFLLMLPASLVMNAASIFCVPATGELGVTLAAYGVNLTIIQLGCAFGDPTILAYLCKRFNMRYVLTGALVLEAICFAICNLTS